MKLHNCLCFSNPSCTYYSLTSSKVTFEFLFLFDQPVILKKPNLRNSALTDTGKHQSSQTGKTEARCNKQKLKLELWWQPNFEAYAKALRIPPASKSQLGAISTQTIGSAWRHMQRMYTQPWRSKQIILKEKPDKWKLFSFFMVVPHNLQLTSTINLLCIVSLADVFSIKWTIWGPNLKMNCEMMCVFDALILTNQSE